MAWEIESNKTFQSKSEPQWEFEGTKPETQSVMDDRDGKIYNVPLAMDGIDTRFEIDTQHKGADKGSFFGKLDLAVDKIRDFQAKFGEHGADWAQSAARGALGTAQQIADTMIVGGTGLREEQYKAEHGYSRYPSFFFGSDESQEEVKAKAKETVAKLEDIRKRNKEWWDAGKEFVKKEKDMDDLDKFFEGLGGGATSVLASVTSSLALRNPVVASTAMALLFGEMRKNELMDEALEQGVDFDKAEAIGTGGGVIEGALEFAGDLFLSRFAKLKPIMEAKDRVMSSAVVKAAKDRIGKEALKKIATKHTDSVIGGFSKGFASEMFEEMSQTGAGMAYENVTGLSNHSLDEIYSNVLMSGIIGGLTGGVPGAVGTAFNNKLIRKTNNQIKELIKQDAPSLNDQELQVMADSVQEMLYQESTTYVNELNNVLEKEKQPEVLNEGLTPEQLTAETRKLLQEKYNMKEEDINKTIKSALSIIDARGQFNEAYSQYYDALTTGAGRSSSEADGAARLLAARALAVARAEKVQVKDVMDRWNLRFQTSIENKTELEANSKPIVEFNAVTFEDTENKEEVKKAFLKNGFSKKAADDAIANLQKVVDFAKQLGQESERLREQNERNKYVEQRPTEDVSKYETEEMSLAVDSGKKTLGMVPRVSIFVKNGDYQYNIDFGTTCTRREPLEAAVKIMIDMGKAGNLGLSQINNIKDILGKHGFTKPCVLCFVEGKRTYELVSANRLSRQWNVVLKSVGVEDAKVIGTERELTDEMIKRLKEMSEGDGYEKYVDKKYRDKNEKDPVGLTKARAKAISKIMIGEYERTGKSTLVNRMRPDMLMNSRGTDYLFRKYVTDAPTLRGLIAARDGAGTPKPHTSYPVYDTKSWKDMFDLKQDVEKEVKHLFDIGGVRLQSFSDFNEYMVIDYLQAMLDLAARKLPAHSYTKVTSFVELFGEMLNINMSLIGEPAKGVPAEYDGLRPAKEGEKVVLEDENGKWTYNWATESFDPKKAFELRKEARFKGKVGTVGIGISDKQILAMLNDPEIDMVIPFHKSGIQDHVLISAGLKRADGTEVKDYSDVQNTKKPKGFKEDYLFNERMQVMKEAKDVAADYLLWCKNKNCTPKFKQFSTHKNYYKLLEDFRSYDNNGKPVVQKAVEFKTGDNFNEILANAIRDRDDVVGAISKIQNNEALMRDLEEAVRYYHLDGELKKVMLNKIEKALGGKEHLKVLSQEDMMEELSKTNPEDAQEFRDGKGVLYGFAKGGQIFLNVQGFNANTPVHEYSHIWARVVQSTNKKLWEKGVALLEQTDKWKELEGKEQYKELIKNKDMFASEVFAHIVGENNEEIARYFQDPDAPEYKNRSLKSKILQFIKDVFGHIRSMFDPKFKLSDVKEVKDFATMALLDLYDDGRATELSKRIKAMRKSGEFLQDTEGDMFFQSAFAGSRVDYDRPSLEAIGSGEGAQAHGWGLYYALNRDVAEGYRNQFVYGTRGSWERELADFLVTKLHRENEVFIDHDDAFNILNGKQQEVAEIYKFDTKRANAILGIDVSSIADEYTKNQKSKGYDVGQTHEVDIPENPYLLDEQKKLTEQSDYVKERLYLVGKEAGLNMSIYQKEDKFFESVKYALGEEGVRLYKEIYALEIQREIYKNESPEIFDRLDDLWDKVGELERNAPRERTETFDANEIYALVELDNSQNTTGGAFYDRLSEALGSDKDASLLLNKYGIKGITYDGRQDGRCFVIFNPDDVKVIQKFYQDQANPEGPRGAYQNSIIYLFENADASTIIHEMGHFFLDDMQKFSDNETTKEQLEAIYKFVGSTDGKLTREQHEYFANAFELYLLEGRAPNNTLQKVFVRFRNWLGRLFAELSRINDVKLTPEIRKVFGQMLGGRGLDFSMQMSAAKMMESLESGVIPSHIVDRAIRLLEEGKMSRADMDDILERLKSGDLKRKEVAQELKKFESGNVKHNEALNPFDRIKYREALSRGNFSKKDVVEKINRLLKWSEPRSQNGKLVGRFSDKRMNQRFAHLRELMAMDKAQAKEKIAENIKLINAIIKGEEVGDTDALAFDNRVLGIVTGKAKAETVIDIYNAISDSYNLGRLTTAVTGEAKKARRARLVQETKDVLTNNGTVNWRQEQSKLKQFVNQLGTSQMSWQGILDILSMNDKSSKTGQSKLSKALDVFDAQQLEAQGVADDGEKASKFMEKRLGGASNAAISVSRYVNSKLQEKFTIEWDGNKKTFTKDQLLDIYMKSKDPETKKMMAEDKILQFNDNFLIEVNQILTAEDRAIANALFEFYDDNYAKINAFYEDKYGISLGKRAFYSPRSMDRGGINVDTGDLSSYAGFSAVKERKAKAGAVKIKGAFQVLQDYIVNSNHWIAWSDKLIDINAVMGDVEVKNMIRNMFGQNMEKRIAYEVSRMASNDKFQSKYFNFELLNKIRSNYAISALAAKPSLMIKQLTSFPAYWEHMSKEEFISGLVDFATHMKEAVETLGNTTLMKTRDVNIIKDFEELSKSELFKSGATKVKLREFLMANIKLGDRGAIYMGGWALYKAELKKNLAKGMKQEDAKARALEMFERVTDETQQSGRLSQQSYWQSNPFLRMFTMFQSSQNQYLRKEINAVRGLATGRMSKTQAAKTLFIFHVLLPCFFQFASDGFEWDKEAQLRASILGSLNGIFILNSILEKGLDIALGTADAWRATKMGISDVLPFWGSGEDLYKFFVDLAEGDVDLEDYIEVIKAFGKPLGELTGVPVKYPLDLIQNFGNYAEEGEVKKEVLLWLGWSPYALRDKDED